MARFVHISLKVGSKQPSNFRV